MNVKLLRLLFFLLISILHFNDSRAQAKRYIKEHKGQTLELSKQYGIPASVILGVAILESGSGRSRNAKLLNNHFGVIGKNNLRKLHPPVKSRYKQYAEVAASYRDFCKVISHKKFYKQLKGDGDYKKWTSQISRCGYTSMPRTWKNRVDKTIGKYRLQNLDSTVYE
ncbi:glucosaminidase domain-containing protein [Pinibacter soli]|uniref:Glucosaminidase domain-containing protein n=1 Tax=Pinibacter soli TaxID=3044211 RepID=A0ABT6R8A2_9BACT|nr:glucosaminidase domain-containing protein [Pinibacter soli]MDI3318791.1 glucosaminidase domain-containing protein [Pinibacter soli]